MCARRAPRDLADPYGARWEPSAQANSVGDHKDRLMVIRRFLQSVSLIAFAACGSCSQESAGAAGGGSGTEQDVEGEPTPGSEDVGSPDEAPRTKELAAALAKTRTNAGIRSISAIAWRDGKIAAQAAVGIRDARTDAAATPDSIYMIASCSKPVIGLALALLIQDQPIDLDADINVWLKWEKPPRNPAFPDVPVTLRQLVTHRSSIVADDDSEYATYARPDPDPSMDAYILEQIPNPEMWEDFAPGTQEEYSNVATTLAAYVIEKAAKQPFSEFCQKRIFEPLGLTDTGWFFADFNEEQVARMARPHDEAGKPLEHFGFASWPSGQIRTTTADMAKLWMAIQARKAPFTEMLLADFEKVPFFIIADAEGGTFEHGGSEYGVGAYFIYDGSGNGYAFLTNHEIPEEDSDALDVALGGVLAEISGVKE